MGSIVIYNKNSETLQIRATVTKAEQSIKLLAEDVLNITIGSPDVINFEIGDYIEYCGKTYTLNQLPSVTKKNEKDYSYSCQFEGEQYELLDCAWLLPSNTYGDSFTGNLYDFLKILFENIERTGKSWILGEYPEETEYKTLTYTQTNCLQVLQNLCSEYSVEFQILRDGENRILNLKEQIGEQFPTRFEYGRTGGLYQIDRKTANSKNVITKLFVFGSDKNLPSYYRENKLCLPNKERNESYISDEETTKIYGVKENVKVFSDIYPARYGKVTGTEADVKIFYDTSMDFDLNETDNQKQTKWLIPSTPAKIQFNSGGLAGYSFEIVSYDHYLKRFKIKQFKDANGLEFPNIESKAFQIKIGDEYFITDIRVPESYIKEAEKKLETEGKKYFDENCKPQVNYTIKLDPFFLKKLYDDTKTDVEIFKVGDFIELFDFDLNVLKKLRISAFTRNLLNPYEFNITIAENVDVQTAYQRIIGELHDIKTVIYENDIAAADNARRNWLATQELLNSVFDTEGNYYSEKIKPLSIDTSMLAVGARSQQFVLKDVLFEPNYAQNANTIHNSEGSLDHYTILENGVKTWKINSGTSSNLKTNSSYYIYAKCSRNGDNGIIVYADTYEESSKIQWDSDPQFYYFLIGTLSSVIQGSGEKAARNVALTYGASTINGKFITTGRIQSANRNSYFDLDTGEIAGTFNFTDGLISKSIFMGVKKGNAPLGLIGVQGVVYQAYNFQNNVYYIYTDKIAFYILGNGRFVANATCNDGEKHDVVYRPYLTIYTNGRLQFGTFFYNGIPSQSTRSLSYTTDGAEMITPYGDVWTMKPDSKYNTRFFQVPTSWRGTSAVGTVSNIFWIKQALAASGNIYSSGIIYANDFRFNNGNSIFEKLKKLVLYYGIIRDDLTYVIGGSGRAPAVQSYNGHRHTPLEHLSKGKYRLHVPDYIGNCLCFANITNSNTSHFYVAADLQGYYITFNVADDSTLNDLTTRGVHAYIQFAVINFQGLFNL